MVFASLCHRNDRLDSWNDGPARQSIINFVEKVTKPRSPDFLPVPERIAGGGLGVAGICAQPTPELLKLQADIIAGRRGKIEPGDW